MSVSVISTPPDELVVSADQDGTVKVWTLEHAVSDVPVSALQSISPADCQHVSSFVPAFSSGILIAVAVMVVVVVTVGVVAI